MFRRFRVMLLGGVVLSAVLVGLHLDKAAGTALTAEELSARWGSSDGMWCLAHNDCQGAGSPCPGDAGRCEGKNEGDHCGDDPEFFYAECCNVGWGNNYCRSSAPYCVIVCGKTWSCFCGGDPLGCGVPMGASVIQRICKADDTNCSVTVMKCDPE